MNSDSILARNLRKAIASIYIEREHRYKNVNVHYIDETGDSPVIVYIEFTHQLGEGISKPCCISAHVDELNGIAEDINKLIEMSDIVPF